MKATVLRRGLVGVAAAVLIAGCGGSSGDALSAPTTPPASVDTSVADKAEITAAWEGFFDAGGTVDSHLAKLEDGDKFRAELTAFAKDPANKDLAAKVTDVVISGTSAKVTYDLLGKGGTVLLGGSVGEAIKTGGKWLVSKKTYCQLVALQDPNGSHPGCA